MTFNDLPADWSSRPVTDPQMFGDVIDLLVGDQDRATGTIHVLLCDESGRLLQPCAVTAGGLAGDESVADTERRALIDPFATALAAQHPNGGLIVALGRPGATTETATDRRWQQAAEATCRQHHLRLLGCAVATRGGVFRLPDRCEAP
jgi:hypothetical protein